MLSIMFVAQREFESLTLSVHKIKSNNAQQTLL